MKSVTFERCTLARAGFAEAEMEDVDLRSSAVAEIGAGTLAGATVDPTQLIELAGHLARTLGIRVKL